MKIKKRDLKKVLGRVNVLNVYRALFVNKPAFETYGLRELSCWFLSSKK